MTNHADPRLPSGQQEDKRRETTAIALAGWFNGQTQAILCLGQTKAPRSRKRKKQRGSGRLRRKERRRRERLRRDAGMQALRSLLFRGSSTSVGQTKERRVGFDPRPARKRASAGKVGTRSKPSHLKRAFCAGKARFCQQLRDVSSSVETNWPSSL